MGTKKETVPVPKAPIQEPKEFKGDEVKTTKISLLKDVINEKLEQLKDLGSMEVLLPVDVRLKKRQEAIRKMSQAESLKINRHWKTTAPQMHIAGLEGRKHSETEAEIRFSVYETDKEGNKKLYEHYGEVELANGEKVKRVKSAEYRVAYEAVEIIRFRKPIRREIIRVNEGVK